MNDLYSYLSSEIDQITRGSRRTVLSSTERIHDILEEEKLANFAQLAAQAMNFAKANPAIASFGVGATTALGAKAMGADTSTALMLGTGAGLGTRVSLPTLKNIKMPNAPKPAPPSRQLTANTPQPNPSATAEASMPPPVTPTPAPTPTPTVEPIPLNAVSTPSAPKPRLNVVDLESRVIHKQASVDLLQYFILRNTAL